MVIDKRMVAIVDDDAIFAEYVQGIVSSDGFSTIVFSDIDELYGELSSNPSQFKSIVLDRYIGDIDTVRNGVVPYCRSMGHSGKIVLITSSGVEQLAPPEVCRFDAVFSKHVSEEWGLKLLTSIR